MATDSPLSSLSRINSDWTWENHHLLGWPSKSVLTQNNVFFYTWTTSATGCVFCLDDVREKKVPPESTVRICWDNTPPIDSAFFYACFFRAASTSRSWGNPQGIYTSIWFSPKILRFVRKKTCATKHVGSIGTPEHLSLWRRCSTLHECWFGAKIQSFNRALRGEPPRFVAGRVCWFHVSLLVSLLSTVP